MVFALVAWWVTSGEIYGLRGIGPTTKDSPLFWVLVVGMSGTGVWQFVKGLTGWGMQVSSDDPQPEAERDEGDADASW